MYVLPPITMTTAKLTSSTLVETAPAAYAGGTTYAINDTVSVAGAAGLLTVYKSLQGSNTGHTPSSSPTWWENIGDTYQEYSGAATYAAGDMVQVATTHRVYESLVAGNTGNAVTDTTKWLGSTDATRVSTNMWAMFDYLTSAPTTSPVTITAVVTPGERVGTWCLRGLIGTQLTVSMTSATGGGTVYTYTENLTTRIVLDWYDYFFAPFSNRASEFRVELPPFSDGIITVTLTPLEGVAEIGALVLGTAVYLGAADHSAESGVLNFSTVTRDAFGVATLVPRRNVPRTKQSVICDKVRVNKLLAVRTALNAIPAVWTTVDDENHEYFEAFIVLGIYKEFTINASHPNNATVALEIEEV